MEPDSLSEAYQRLRLAHDLAVAISAASSVDEAFAATLRLFSEAGDWVVAQVWLPDPSGEQLICGPVWYQREPGFEPFRAASLALHFRPGEPLLGSVWQQGEAKWAEDIDVNVAAFRRTDAAAESGLSAALAVPVCSNRGVIAVLEFLTQSQAPRMSGLRDLIDTAAAQLSSLMEQKLAETLLRRSEERFRAVADTASDSIVSIDATGTITYVNRAGTLITLVNGLNQPTSMEVIKNTAYVVTLPGEIWRVGPLSDPPYGAVAAQGRDDRGRR